MCQTTLTVHNYNVCGCCWYCCGRHFGPFLVTPVKVVSFICAALFCWPLFRQHVILKGRRKPNFRVGETGLTYFSLLEKKQKKSSVVICTRFYCPWMPEPAPLWVSFPRVWPSSLLLLFGVWEFGRQGCETKGWRFSQAIAAPPPETFRNCHRSGLWQKTITMNAVRKWMGGLGCCFWHFYFLLVTGGVKARLVTLSAPSSATWGSNQFGWQFIDSFGEAVVFFSPLKTVWHFWVFWPRSCGWLRQEKSPNNNDTVISAMPESDGVDGNKNVTPAEQHKWA